MPRIQITDLAKRDIAEAFDWWAEQRSTLEAAEWYDRIFDAIKTLKSMPERCPVIAEAIEAPGPVRQLLFGSGSRPTHRIVFYFDDETDTVTVLRVRHHGQGDF